MNENDMRLKWMAEHSPESYRDVIKRRFGKALEILEKEVRPRILKGGMPSRKWVVKVGCPHCRWDDGFFNCQKCLWPASAAIRKPEPMRMYCTHIVTFEGVAYHHVVSDSFVCVSLTANDLVISGADPDGASPLQMAGARTDLEKAIKFCRGHVKWADKYQWGKHYGEKD